MTREQKQLYQHSFKRCRSFITVCIAVVVILALVKMVMVNRAATWGFQLETLKQQTEEIKKQNLYLQAQLAQQAGGLDQLTLQAQAQGFVDKPQVKYFTPGAGLAQKLP